MDQAQLRGRLLEILNTIRWVPDSGIERMRSMLTTRPDWCLSRQRLWGVPLPAMRCEECGYVFLSDDIIEKTARIFAQESSNSWFIHDSKIQKIIDKR